MRAMLGASWTLAVRHVARGPVARAGVAAVTGVAVASVAWSVGPGILAPGVPGTVVDAVWIGIAAMVACQVVLAGVALLAPDGWRVTRRG